MLHGPIGNLAPSKRATHYSQVTWLPLCPKSPAIRLALQQLIQTNENKISKIDITGTLWWGIHRRPVGGSNVQSVSMPWQQHHVPDKGANTWLTYTGLNRNGRSRQTTFFNVYSRKQFTHFCKIITNTTRTLMTIHHYFRCRFGVVRQQAVTWSNVDWISIVRAYGYNSYRIRSSYQRFITKTRYWLERVSIALMGNGSTKSLSQLKSYSRV